MTAADPAVLRAMAAFEEKAAVIYDAATGAPLMIVADTHDHQLDREPTFNRPGTRQMRFTAKEYRALRHVGMIERVREHVASAR